MWHLTFISQEVTVQNKNLAAIFIGSRRPDVQICYQHIDIHWDAASLGTSYARQKDSGPAGLFNSPV
jgi:hypothetical protein